MPLFYKTIIYYIYTLIQIYNFLTHFPLNLSCDLYKKTPNPLKSSLIPEARPKPRGMMGSFFNRRTPKPSDLSNSD
jgi:hypothetical protein